MTDDSKYGSFNISTRELIFFHDKMVDMLRDAHWPGNGLGVALLEFFTISQHRRAGVTLEQGIEQYKAIWSMCEQVDSGTPDSKLKVM